MFPITVSAVVLHLTFAFVICYLSNKKISYKDMCTIQYTQTIVARHALTQRSKDQ